SASAQSSQYQTMQKTPWPKSALASLIAAIGLVDDVDPALPAHQTIIAVPAAQGLKGIADFHDNLGCCLPATYAGDRALSTRAARWLEAFPCSTVRPGD